MRSDEPLQRWAAAASAEGAAAAAAAGAVGVGADPDGLERGGVVVPPLLSPGVGLRGK